MTLGEKIQQLRKDRKLSQEQLALEMNVSRQAVSKWELGESIPDTDHVVMLSKYFEISIDSLLRDEFQLKEEKKESVESKSGYKKVMLIMTMSALIIGLMLSIVFWITYQSIILTSMGLIIQLIALICLIINQPLMTLEERRLCYVLGVWFTLLFPCLFLMKIIMSFYPRPRLAIVDVLLGWGLYLGSCGILTWMIKQKRH